MNTPSAFTVVLSAREARLLQFLAAGAFAPVEGFMDAETAMYVRRESALPDGRPWTEALELFVAASPALDGCTLKDGEGRTIGRARFAPEPENTGLRRVLGLPDDLVPDDALRAQLAALRASPRPLVAYVVEDCLHRADVAHLQAQVPEGHGLLLLRLADCSDEPCHLQHAVALANHAALANLASLPVTLLDVPRLNIRRTGAAAMMAAIARNLGARRLLPGPVEPGLHTRVVKALTRRDNALVDTLTWPDVARLLRAAYLPAGRRGMTLLLTGLSGAGKSTIAKQLTDTLMTRTRRPVSLLDGDLIRQHLSRGLGFSRADREANMMRIAFVAREIARHGGIAICCPIAPYASTRARIRDWVSEVGAFVEIHVATPIDVCEQRDPKGLYQQARSGKLRGFTGIDDPYEPPEAPELRLDTSRLSVDQSVDRICEYLEDNGLLRTENVDA